MTTTKGKAEILGAEAIRKLEAYVATGIEGLRMQGMDRVRELGIRADDSQWQGKEAAARMVEHLRLTGW